MKTFTTLVLLPAAICLLIVGCGNHDATSIALRYKPTVGDCYRVVGSSEPLGTRSKNELHIGVTIEVTVQRVADDGTSTNAIEIVDVLFNRSRNVRGVDQFIGVKGSVVVDVRGAVKSMRLRQGVGFDAKFLPILDEIKRRIVDMICPLPDAPVQLGSEWEVDSETAALEIEMARLSTYTLRSHAANRAAVDFITRYAAGKQGIEGWHGDREVKLISATAHSSGSIEFDTSRVFPLWYTSDIESEMAWTKDGHTDESRYETRVTAGWSDDERTQGNDPK